LCAWREFRRGKRSKPDVQQFEFNLEENIMQLHEALAAKTYIGSPYESFYVADPKLRHIHKASVRDRVLHQALFRILYPIFDQSFIYDSYSCRLKKGVHAGVSRLACFARTASSGYARVVYGAKLDIRKFFDSINHSILFNLIRKKINDPDTLQLISLIINSFETTRGMGLPLGNVTSQLFANIYLNELDQFVKNKMKIRQYLRYCDDFIFLHANRDYIDECIRIIDTFLCTELGLE